MGLALDFTGTLPANLVTDTVPLQSSYPEFPFVFFQNSPAFGRSVVVTYVPDNEVLSRVLLKDVDYQIVFRLPGVGTDDETRFWGAIQILNYELVGSLSIQYQALGGNWTMMVPQIKTYLTSNSYNQSQQEIVLAPAQPLVLPAYPGKTYPIFSQDTITAAQAGLTNVPIAVIFQKLEAPLNSVGAPTLRKPNVINLAASTTGTTIHGAVFVEIQNTGSTTITFDDATLPAGTKITISTKGNDVIDTIPWSIPTGGSALLTQLV